LINQKSWPSLAIVNILKFLEIIIKQSKVKSLTGDTSSTQRNYIVNTSLLKGLVVIMWLHFLCHRAL